MSLCVDVERIEVGDRITVWLGDGPKAVVVAGISEGADRRTLQVSHGGTRSELDVLRGHTVDLIC